MRLSELCQMNPPDMKLPQVLYTTEPTTVFPSSDIAREPPMVGGMPHEVTATGSHEAGTARLLPKETGALQVEVAEFQVHFATERLPALSAARPTMMVPAGFIAIELGVPL